MKLFKRGAIAVLMGAGLMAAASGAANAAECGTDRTIDIAEMGWPSAAALANVHALILEEGFGCDVELVVGDTVPTLASMSTKGEPAFAPEMWPNASQEAWDKAVADGMVENMGPAIAEGLVQGWYIPTYVAEAHPDLTHVEDLADYTELFADPDDPDKGRFLSCPPGWACETMNPNFMKAYGLDDDYNVFSPGSGGALDATITRAFVREEPVVFYYWGPTAMMGRYDMTRLDMDAFDADKFACMGEPDCADPQRTDFVVPDALKALASWVPEEAPAVADYISKVEMTNAEVGRMLLWGEENSADAEATARNFLATEEDLWTQWVPEDVAANVKAAL